MVNCLPPIRIFSSLLMTLTDRLWPAALIHWRVHVGDVNYFQQSVDSSYYDDAEMLASNLDHMLNIGWKMKFFMSIFEPALPQKFASILKIRIKF